MADLINYKIIANLVKVKDTFIGLLKDKSIDNAQLALEYIDESFQTLDTFDRPYGLYPLEDKEKLFAFDASLEDLYFLLGNFDSNLVYVYDEMKRELEDFKSNILPIIENNKIDAEVINLRLNQLEDCCQGDHRLTSSFASFSFESDTPDTEFIIQHNLNSFDLIGDPLVLNDDNEWEKDLAKIVYLDENTIKVILTEPRMLMLNMVSVEFFVSFIYEGYGKDFIINHNLKSNNLLHSVLSLDSDSGQWESILCQVRHIDTNNISISLTENQTVKISLLRV